ncbi:MAG: gamma-glutamylcyclotransferase [Dongiaceae bacterium]
MPPDLVPARHGPAGPADAGGPGGTASSGSDAGGEAALVASRRVRPPEGRDFWVFGYGSLMWRPGFEPAAALPALLRGWHRAFCIYSHHYRGTPDDPGLVLGLDRGGACRGRALLVPAERAAAVADYLHEREMITGVYRPRWVAVDSARGRLTALTYVADRDHPQYTGKLEADRVVELILRARGESGTNRSYLENTVRHLDELGVVDCPLHRLLRQVEARAAAA